MKGGSGKWDWVANEVGFAFCYLQQPWTIPGGILAELVFAFTGKRLCSNWFPVIPHSGQSVYFLVLILGVVLGLARPPKVVQHLTIEHLFDIISTLSNCRGGGSGA
jgi:hypothetical protein